MPCRIVGRFFAACMPLTSQTNKGLLVMFTPFPVRLGASAVLLCSVSTLAQAQATFAPDPDSDGEIILLTPIVVDADVPQHGPMSTILTSTGQSSSPASDAAEVLRAVPGVTSGRMGGHGLELVIRGQQQNQLNIIDAGSFTYGACPNRMDPPTSSASFLRADEIVIERGYASVTHGPGGSGGTVILERDAPELES